MTARRGLRPSAECGQQSRGGCRTSATYAPPSISARVGSGLRVSSAVVCWPALIAAVWRWRQRQQLARRTAAHELALARLREARKFMAPGACLRVLDWRYRGSFAPTSKQRFDIRAAHRTTLEFLRDFMTETDGSLAAAPRAAGSVLAALRLGEIRALGTFDSGNGGHARQRHRVRQRNRAPRGRLRSCGAFRSTHPGRATTRWSGRSVKS